MPPDHDRLFKTLLRAFLGDLLRLVVPGIAGRLDAAGATFIDKELLVEGQRREAVRARRLLRRNLSRTRRAPRLGTRRAHALLRRPGRP
jgi:hypothetical protein